VWRVGDRDVNDRLNVVADLGQLGVVDLVALAQMRRVRGHRLPVAVGALLDQFVGRLVPGRHVAVGGAYGEARPVALVEARVVQLAFAHQCQKSVRKKLAFGTSECERIHYVPLLVELVGVLTFVTVGVLHALAPVVAPSRRVHLALCGRGLGQARLLDRHVSLSDERRRERSDHEPRDRLCVHTSAP